MAEQLPVPKITIQFEDLDKSLLDDKTLELLDLGESSIEKSDEIDNDAYIQNELGISIPAIKEGLTLREERKKTEMNNYYTSVYENIIKPNKNWSGAVYEDAVKLAQKKHGEGATPGYADEATIFEAAKPFIDNMYEFNPDIQQEFQIFEEKVNSSTKGKEAMLLSGISSDESLAVWPRLITELLGANADPALKKSLITTAIQRSTGNPEAQVEVGTFKELTQGIYNGDTPDAWAYRIDDGLITPVNLPGMDTKDIAMFLRELPNIGASIAAGSAMIVSGYGIPATAAASSAAVAAMELATNGLGFAYEKMNTTGEVTEKEIIEFLKNASKDSAFAGALEGTFGIIIPGLATVIKRTIKKGKVAPGKLRKAYEESLKGGDKGSEEAIKELAKINEMMLSSLGKNPNSADGTWIDLSILQTFKGSIPATKLASGFLPIKNLTAVELAATKIVKDTSEAFQQIFSKNIDGVTTPGQLPDFIASPTVLYGEAFQKIAKGIENIKITELDSLFVPKIDELTTILNVVNKSNVLENPEAVFNVNMIKSEGQIILSDLITKGNDNIALTFLDKGVKLTDEIIRPINLRTSAYQFLKSIDEGLLKNLDEPQQKALKEIVKKLSVYTKNTPGPGKLKDLSYNQVDSILNQLNEMIDNPSLYGGLGKNNKTLVMAGALREDLETGIKKALGDENWGKIKVLRSELKSISDLRKGKLMKDILKSDEFYGAQNIDAFFTSIKSNPVVMSQLSSLFNRMPSLIDQKSLFKMAILTNLKNAIDGPTGDLLNVAIRDKNFKTVSKNYKTWMTDNRKSITSFFTKEEMKILDKGGIKAVDLLDQLSQKRAKEMKHMQNYTGKIVGMEPQSMMDFFKSNPTQLKQFFEDGIKNKIFGKDEITNFKRYAAMQFNNKTLASNGNGVYLYDPEALAKEVLDSPDFYKNLYGQKWLDDTLEMANFLKQYYAPIKTIISSADNSAARDALQNVFMGQLDRKRTFIRGTLNLLGIYDVRDWSKYISFKDFRQGYKNAYLSKTSKIFLEPINAITAADERGPEREKGEALLERFGKGGTQALGLGVGVVDKAIGVAGNYLSPGQ